MRAGLGWRGGGRRTAAVWCHGQVLRRGLKQVQLRKPSGSFRDLILHVTAVVVTWGVRRTHAPHTATPATPRGAVSRMGTMHT